MRVCARAIRCVCVCGGVVMWWCGGVVVLLALASVSLSRALLFVVPLSFVSLRFDWAATAVRCLNRGGSAGPPSLLVGIV